MSTSPRLNGQSLFLLLSVALLGTAALSLMAVPGLPTGPALLSDGGGIAPAPPALEVRLAKGTEGQLRQVALHLSKMNGGESVGGFPGFEPPEEDEEYRRKVQDRSYTPEEANHWVKEVNGFLKWLVKRNPDLSLEQMLQRQGLTQAEIENFIEVLQDTFRTAEGMEGYGVHEMTVKTPIGKSSTP